MWKINEHKLYTTIYGLLINQHLPFWFLTPFRRFFRWLGNKRLPIYYRSTQVEKYEAKEKLKDVIVSFTSFPARIEYVWMVVQSIKRQTILPSKIILWLSREQFPDKKLPESLQNEIDIIFEVRFVDDDIKSHKKYLYISREFCDKYIFLIDDDIIYEPDILERVWAAHLREPLAVISNYGFKMVYEDYNIPAPYKLWKENFKESKDRNLFFGSGGGTLIRPSLMYKDLINIALARELTPTADDIWLNAMMRLANNSCYMIKHGLYFRIEIPSNTKLATLNVAENQNDKQIKALIDFYIRAIGVNPFKKQ